MTLRRAVHAGAAACCKRRRISSSRSAARLKSVSMRLVCSESMRCSTVAPATAATMLAWPSASWTISNVHDGLLARVAPGVTRTLPTYALSTGSCESISKRSRFSFSCCQDRVSDGLESWRLSAPVCAPYGRSSSSGWCRSGAGQSASALPDTADTRRRPVEQAPGHFARRAARRRCRR